MDERPSSRRRLVWATLVALVAPLVWAALGGFSHGVHICLRTRSEDPLAGAVFCPDGPADIEPALTRWVLYATVVLAIAYSVRIRTVRPDIIALVIWTIAFWLVATGTPLAIVCTPADVGDPHNASCYPPWTPGWSRMEVWVVVSAAILVIGFLVRRIPSGRRLQVSF